MLNLLEVYTDQLIMGQVFYGADPLPT